MIRQGGEGGEGEREGGRVLLESWPPSWCMEGGERGEEEREEAQVGLQQAGSEGGDSTLN